MVPRDDKYKRFGKYVLLDRISVGGMAEVFRARQTGVEGFAKTVAIKRILPAIAEDEDFIEMFVDEAKLAVHMAHANVVQIYDLGNVTGQYYIAMEYVAGSDLRTVWDRARRRNRLLPIAMSAYIMQKVCEGLDYAHRKKDETGQDIGLVHRDVSPQNILVSFEGEVKVVDFGIAKASATVSKTQAGVLKGKFGYMSPEQVRGRDLDHRSDIFACGIVLWELLVGDRLFLGETDFSTLEKVRNVDLVPPTHFNKGLSPQIERIVMKALSKDPQDRYRWASEMAEDLQRFLFSTNQPFARTDLQRYMKQHFEEEIQAEYARLEKYRELRAEDVEEPPVAPSRAGGEVVTGETQVGGLLPGQTQATAPGLYDFGGGLIPQAIPVPEDEPSRSPAPTPPTPGRLSKGVKLALLGLGLVAVSATGFGLFVLSGGLRPAPGTVTLDVAPADAEIYLNDQLVSTRSPFSRSDIEPGTYVLRVQREGYDPTLKTLKVISGQALKETIVLAAQKGQASIMVRSVPDGFDIWLDTEPTGQKTPGNVTQLMPGTYKLELKRDGEVVESREVELGPRTVMDVNVDLSRLPPLLIVKSGIASAEVLVNGRKLGSTPLKLTSLAPGSVQVSLQRKGCKKRTEKVTLVGGGRVELDWPLDCD